MTLSPSSTRSRALAIGLGIGIFCLIMAGCPVYGDRDMSQVECADGKTHVRVDPGGTCKCENLKVLKVGEPIPGVDVDSIPRRGGTFSMIVDSNIPNLNRLLHADAWIKQIILHDVCQALVEQDPRDYRFRPELATDWASNEMGTVWTFHLREGVFWHDGEPFTSRDVKFTFDAVLNPNNRTEVIRSDWEDMLETSNAYEAPDDHTFIIRLKRPSAFFLPNLEGLTIIPEHIFSRGDFNTHPNNRAPIGTGPFKFKEWTSQAIVLERNPHYWGRPAYLDSIVYRFVLDRDTAFSMIKRGDVDFIERLMPYQRDEGITPDLLERFNVIDLLPAQFSFWVYNTQRPQFSDARTRIAMTMLMNRKQMLCELYQCQGVQTTGPIPMHHPAYDQDLVPHPYDPEAASRLLSEAGWTDSDGDGIRDKMINGQRVPFSFTFLLTQNSRVLEQMATMVQNSMARVGVDMKMSKLDWSVFSGRLLKQDFDAASLIWHLPHDPDLYPLFHSQGPQNLGKWKNEELDILVDKSRYIIDDTIRNLVLKRAHQIVYEEQPYTSLFVVTRPAMIKKEFCGVYTSDNWFQEYDIWMNDPSFPIVPPEERHPGHQGAPPYDATGR